MRSSWLAVVSALSVACQTAIVVPTNDDVASWSEHRTVAGDRAIVYKLPPDPRVEVFPRRVVPLVATSGDSTPFAIVDYGYQVPQEPGSEQLRIVMQIQSLGGGGVEESWSPKQFADFYQSRIHACDRAEPPRIHLNLLPLVFVDSRELGEGIWNVMAYSDMTRDRVTTDVFVRPMSRTHVLVVSGIYSNYTNMFRTEIDHTRALMREIVSEIRVEPPFGPVKAVPSPP